MRRVTSRSSPAVLKWRREASHTWSFFSQFSADHPEPSSAADVENLSLRNLRQACEKMAAASGDSLMPTGPKQMRSLFQTAALYEAGDFSESDIRRHFPGKFRHEEFDGLRRHSFFFGDDSRHVVLKSKEIALARPHGHIMRSGQGLMPDAEVMSCTCYAAGVFASQLAVGNTVFGKFLSNREGSTQHHSIKRAADICANAFFRCVGTVGCSFGIRDVA